MTEAGGTTCRLASNHVIIQCDKMLVLANIPLFCFFGGRSVLLSFVVSEEAELCNHSVFVKCMNISNSIFYTSTLYILCYCIGLPTLAVDDTTYSSH